jgi:hypothetical protein
LSFFIRDPASHPAMRRTASQECSFNLVSGASLDALVSLSSCFDVRCCLVVGRDQPRRGTN